MLFQRYIYSPLGAFVKIQPTTIIDAIEPCAERLFFNHPAAIFYLIASSSALPLGPLTRIKTADFSDGMAMSPACI
jgi:hypothetical protein